MPPSERVPDRATRVRESVRSWLPRAIFVMYAAFVLWITLGLFRSPEPGWNLQPLRSILHALREGSRHEVIVNLIGNVAAFVPLGFLYPLLRPQSCSFAGSIVFCFCFSSFIEIAQYGLGERVADVDDVILNTLGGVVGVVLNCVSRRLGNARSSLG
jgi:glycopeptide antibiotics resistance protein